MDQESTAMFSQGCEGNWADASLAIAGHELIQWIFQENVSLNSLASMVGAPTGSTVLITPNFEKGRVVVSVTNTSYTLRMKRSIWRSDEGIVIEHEEIFVDLTGNAIGTRIVAKSIDNYVNAGFVRVEAFAEGDRNSRAFSGFYLWPRMGFKMVLTEDKRDEAALRGFEASDTHELMQFEGGVQWWLENGHEGFVEFDLASDSLHNEILAKYLQLKDIQVS